MKRIKVLFIEHLPCTIGKGSLESLRFTGRRIWIYCQRRAALKSWHKLSATYPKRLTAAVRKISSGRAGAGSRIDINERYPVADPLCSKPAVIGVVNVWITLSVIVGDGEIH